MPSSQVDVPDPVLLCQQAGVSIYVIDTGIRVTHEQFGYLNGSAGSRAQSGYDFIDDDRNADDCTGVRTPLLFSDAIMNAVDCKTGDHYYDLIEF